jgi:hypothetical protein
MLLSRRDFTFYSINNSLLKLSINNKNVTPFI